MNSAMTLEKKQFTDIFILLPIVALCVDLFTPYPIWMGFLPSWIRWGSHAAVAAMILVSVFRMFGLKHIPRAALFILAVSVVWSYIARGSGQGIPVTIWGVWLLFQFPLVALFMYLQPNPPEKLPTYLRTYGLLILGIQVIIQLFQYAVGVRPGDDLSGLFGRNGTGNAVLFDILICCVFFGYWIASKKWAGLAAALFLSAVSSVLGEMKLFPVTIIVIGLIAIVLYTIKYKAPGKMLFFLALILVVVMAFSYFYNIIVPDADTLPLQVYITNPSALYGYLNNSYRHSREGGVYTDIGRGHAVQIGWQSLQKTPLTLLFGYGLGTRSESQTFGTAGVALTTGDLGLSVGTSMLVLMQEMGLLGMFALGGLILWILLSLFVDIRGNPDSPATELRYALLLFSLLWAVWLLYATSWTMRVPMLLYWLSLGYVLAEARTPFPVTVNKVF
ncbi:MAG: hypothetical protein HY865_20115 [Chloroflexi bacterium]|nr:hypothetical protein [Chloroflexota bacterium]